MTAHDSRPISVLGATGKTGRPVAARLAERGIAVRAGSRRAEPPFDWGRPAAWPAALDGARPVYIAYQPDLAVPGAVETVGAIARLAADSGVERLVLLAGRGEPEAEDAERVSPTEDAPRRPREESTTPKGETCRSRRTRRSSAAGSPSSGEPTSTPA